MSSNHSGQLWSSQATQFPYEFPCHWSSSSTSFATANEAENEDDYIAGLAERVAHSMLDDEDDNTSNATVESRTVTSSFGLNYSGQASMAASPTSTLPGLGSWCCSSKDSSCVSSQIYSPSSTPLKVQDDTWNLIYAAAGEVARLQMLEEVRTSAACFPVRAASYHHSKVLVPGFLSQPLPVAWDHGLSSVQHRMHSSFCQVKGFQARSNSYPAASAPCDRTYRHPSSLKYSLSTTEQKNSMQFPASISGSASSWACQIKPVHQHGAAVCRGGQKAEHGNKAVWVCDSASFSSPLSHPGASRFQAAFLGPNIRRRESSGTGVFLPPRTKNTTETKKPFLPSRIVRALKLNAANMQSLAIEANASLHGTVHYKEASYHPVSAPASSVNRMLLQQTRVDWTDCDRLMHPSQCPLSEVDSETSLPSEWSY